jgi:hypothetical protein
MSLAVVRTHRTMGAPHRASLPGCLRLLRRRPAQPDLSMYLASAGSGPAGTAVKSTCTSKAVLPAAAPPARPTQASTRVHQGPYAAAGLSTGQPTDSALSRTTAHWHGGGSPGSSSPLPIALRYVGQAHRWVLALGDLHLCRFRLAVRAAMRWGGATRNAASSLWAECRKLIVGGMPQAHCGRGWTGRRRLQDSCITSLQAQLIDDDPREGLTSADACSTTPKGFNEGVRAGKGACLAFSKDTVWHVSPAKTSAAVCSVLRSGDTMICSRCSDAQEYTMRHTP